jgi:hypothetical protein
MANRKEPREALTEDLRAFAEDVRRFLEDPKKRERKERAWRMLEASIALGLSLAARQVAMKLWPLLTGEKPPVRRPGPPPKMTETPRSPATPSPTTEPSMPGAEAAAPTADATTRIAEPPAPSAETPVPAAGTSVSPRPESDPPER